MKGSKFVYDYVHALQACITSFNLSINRGRSYIDSL